MITTIIQKNDNLKELINKYDDIVFRLCELFYRMNIQNDPVRIFTAFTYMYENGLLSNNMVFDKENYPNEYIEYEKSVESTMDSGGAFVISGYGVCRHLSDYLLHIYNTLGYYNSLLFTYCPKLNIKINDYENSLSDLEKQKYLDEVLKRIDYYSKSSKMVKKDFGKLSITVNYYPPELNVKKYGYGNHALNIVMNKNDTNVHMLDPTLKCFALKNGGKEIRLKGSNKYDFIQLVQNDKLLFKVYNGSIVYSKGLDLFKYDADNQDNIEKIRHYQEECNAKRKEFDLFYQHNQERYNDISNHIKKLVKGKIIYNK